MLPRLTGVVSNRRASVAIVTALVAPVLAGVSALGIEVSNWSVATLEVQRAADIAAVAGMLKYKSTGNAQTTALAAARLAEVNGANGTSSPTWDNTSQTLSDNDITAQIVSGVRKAGDSTIEVTVRRTIPTTLSRIFSSTQSVTVSATGYAELVASGGGGGQPCMLGLGGGSDNSAVGNDVTFTGSVSIGLSSCTIRSDDDIKFNGSVSVSGGAIYAEGSVSQIGSVSVSSPIYPNSGQIPDPYADFAPVQNALNAARTATGPAVSISKGSNIALSPGSYTGLSVTGSTNVTLSPGLYLVNGDVSFAGSSNVTGTGVTIVASGTISTAGSTNLNLTAASTSSATNGAIPGIVLASSSASDSIFAGSANVPFTGAMYFPNANLKFNGSVSGTQDGCGEIIARTVTMEGSVSLAANCATYGLPSFSSLPTTTTATLVR